MKLRQFAAVTMFLLASIFISEARAEQASSIVLANTCFSCHGTDGQSVGAMPTIKGKPAAYIESVMNAFREDKKQGTVMNRISKGFTPEEIKAIAKYFASQQ